MIGLKALPMAPLQALVALRRLLDIVPPDSLLVAPPILEEADRLAELASLALIFAYGTLAHYVALEDLFDLLDCLLAGVEVEELLEGEEGVAEEEVEVVAQEVGGGVVAGRGLGGGGEAEVAEVAFEEIEELVDLAALTKDRAKFVVGGFVEVREERVLRVQVDVLELAHEEERPLAEGQDVLIVLALFKQLVVGLEHGVLKAARPHQEL